MNASIYPKFNVTEIYNEFIEKDWFKFQELVYELGEHTLSYIQNFINSRTHREGRTGNLANSIKKYDLPHTGAGEASVGWGIGLISEMNELAPYWYLLNFGGLTAIAKEGRGVGGSFNGEAPDSTKRGTNVGTQRFTQESNSFFMMPKSPIKGLNYIENTRQKLDAEINKILLYLQTHK